MGNMIIRNINGRISITGNKGRGIINVLFNDTHFIDGYKTSDLW